MLNRHPEEIFGAGNWLTDELKRESSISAWDMDDSGKQLRLEHEENCDARNLAAMHALDCEEEENAAQHRREHLAEQADPGFLRALGRNGSGDQGDSNSRDKALATALVAVMAISAAAVWAPFLIGLLPLAVIGFALTAVRPNKR